MIHIEADELALYTMGRVERARATEIEAHVEDCGPCAKALQLEARIEGALQEPSADRPCPGCKRVLAAERCDHCGAASRVAEFRILEIRVQNQHGRLYLAEDTEGRRVALKELCFMQAPSFEALDAFEREARILCALQHPCMPRFIKSFQNGEGIHTRLYLAQEFIDGESLEERLANHYFDETEILAIAKQVLAILVFLQRRSPMVIHRDIKPANLIRRHDGTIVLVDFGAARDQGSTAGATQVGTFGFMPIEQLAGLVDATTDVYALGASLVRLLTRREPWKLLDDPWRYMTVSAGLRRIVQRMTGRHPEDRYPSAGAALAAFDTPARGRRMPIAITATVGLAVVAVGGGLLYESQKPEKPPSGPQHIVVPKPVPANQCEGSSLANSALLFNLARHQGRGSDEARWKRLIGLVSAYRTAVERLGGPAPYRQMPAMEHWLDLPAPNSTSWSPGTRYAGSPIPSGVLDDTVIVVDGDLESTRIDRSIIVATGNVHVADRITDSIVIAGGCVDFGVSLDGSLAIAGTSIVNRPPKGAGGGAFTSSIVAAPMLRAGEKTTSLLFGASWLDVPSPDADREWQPIYDALIGTWTAEPVGPPTPLPQPCDEVSCVLDNYAAACCKKFQKSARSNDLPEALDRSMISDGVGPVKAAIMRCGDQSTAKGIVKVSVKVGPDGNVTSVTIKQAPDPALGACVGRAMQTATFAKTQAGGSFSYPFIF